MISRRPAAGDLARPLAQVRASGLPYLGQRVGPLLFWDFAFLGFCVGGFSVTKLWIGHKGVCLAHSV